MQMVCSYSCSRGWLVSHPPYYIKGGNLIRDHLRCKGFCLTSYKPSVFFLLLYICEIFFYKWHTKRHRKNRYIYLVLAIIWCTRKIECNTILIFLNIIFIFLLLYNSRWNFTVSLCLDFKSEEAFGP